MIYRFPKLYHIFPAESTKAFCADGNEALSLACKSGPEANSGCGTGAAAAGRCILGAAAGSKCDTGTGYE